MGNLGDAVSALLDTYTKCLSLLKRLDRPSQQQLPPDSDDNRSVSVRTVKDASPSGLAAALRKARTKVSRSYSTGVERRGSAFEKGDGECVCFGPAITRCLTANTCLPGLARLCGEEGGRVPVTNWDGSHVEEVAGPSPGPSHRHHGRSRCLVHAQWRRGHGAAGRRWGPELCIPGVALQLIPH
jgi:hypothetical protein